MRARRLACTALLAVALLCSLGACGPSSRPPEASGTSTSTDKSTVPPTPESTSGSESAWPEKVAVGGAALLLGVLLGLALRPRLTRSDAGSGPARGAADSAPVPPPADRPATPGADVTDQALVDGLLAVSDLTDSRAVQAQVRTTLQRAGVVELAAVPGERFDVGRHHAVGVAPTADPGRHMTISRVVRRGWRTSTAVIRPADVEVSRHPDVSG